MEMEGHDWRATWVASISAYEKLLAPCESASGLPRDCYVLKWRQSARLTRRITGETKEHGTIKRRVYS